MLAKTDGSKSGPKEKVKEVAEYLPWNLPKQSRIEARGRKSISKATYGSVLF